MSDNEVEAPNNAATQAIATGHGVTDIAAVALKLPPFWSADPQVWFAQVESQFFTRKITNQDTKFHHIVACLPPEVAVDIRDLIINKPPDNAYDELKNTLIKRTTASRTKRLQQLLSVEELGDRKPSQLLRRFEQLLDGTSSDHPLIREVFLQRLPGNVRQLLTAITTDETPLDELAQKADRLMDVSSHNIATIQHDTHNLATLHAELHDLKETMAAFTKRQNQPSAKKPQEETDNHSSNQCWYHRRFGYKARKCTCSGNEKVSK